MQISNSSKFKGFSIERFPFKAVNQGCDYVQSTYIIVATYIIETTITFLKI